MTIDRIKLETLQNTRDLGEIRAENCPKIKPARLIRSAQLSGATKEEIRLLFEKYGLRRVIDLRTPAERNAEPDPEIDGVSYFHVPLVDNSAIGITREEDGFADLFCKMNDENFFTAQYMSELYRKLISSEQAMEGFGRFFEILLQSESGATLWHCSAGKDRVGITTALLLFALGFDETAVKEDFLATNRFVTEGAKKEIESLAKDGSPHLKENLFAMFTVSPAYLEEALDQIQLSWGNVDTLLQKIGVGAGEKEKLKELYLK